MANTNERISVKRNKVASNLKIVQPLTEDSFYTTEPAPNSQHSSKKIYIHPKTSKKTKLESNMHTQQQILFPHRSKQNEDIFGSSYKIQAETQLGNDPSYVVETNKSKHLRGSDTNPPSNRSRRTHFQNSNNIPNITQGNKQGIHPDIFVPTRNEIIVYNMANPQITPLTSDRLTRRNKRNSFTAEIHQQTGDNVPERNNNSYRENEMPSRDQQPLFYYNSHDRSTHSNDLQQVNANIIVPTREEILYLNNVNPTVQASSVNNGLIEYRRKSAAAYANYLGNQGRNNTINKAYHPSRGSPVRVPIIGNNIGQHSPYRQAQNTGRPVTLPIIGNNIGQHSSYRQAQNTLDHTPLLRNDGHQINHNSPRNKNSMLSAPDTRNTSIDYVYSNAGESEDCALHKTTQQDHKKTTRPGIIRPTFVKHKNSLAHLAQLSTQTTSRFPPFIVPHSDVYYSVSEKKDKRCSSETEKEDATNVQSLTTLYKLNSDVAPPAYKGRTEAVGELQYKTKNARVKCSCGKKMRFMVSVLDNDQRNCKKCYSRVKGEFKDMFESYKKQGFHQCSCKGDLSITDLTNNYLEDKKLECTCDDGFKAVHTCGNKRISQCNKSTTANSLCSKNTEHHHRSKAPCKEAASKEITVRPVTETSSLKLTDHLYKSPLASSKVITVLPVTETGSFKLPDHLHNSSLASSAKEKKNGLGYRITEVHSFSKTSSSNLLSSLQKTVSDSSKNILSSLQKVETCLANTTVISNKTDVVPTASSVILAKESASQLQKNETSKEHDVPHRCKSKFIVLKDTSLEKPDDYAKLSPVSLAKEATSQLAEHERVDMQTGTTDSSSNKPHDDYPKTSSVPSAKEMTSQLAKHGSVDAQTETTDSSIEPHNRSKSTLVPLAKETTSQLAKHDSVDAQTETIDSSIEPHNRSKSSLVLSAKETTQLAKYETVTEQTGTKDSSLTKIHDLPKSSSKSSANKKSSQLAKYKTVDEPTVSKANSSKKSINCFKSSSAKENTRKEGSHRTVKALPATETARSDGHHSRHKRSSHSSTKKKEKSLAAIDSSHSNDVRHSSSSTKCMSAKRSEPKKQNSPGSNSIALAALDSSHSNDVRHSSSSAKLRAKRSKPKKQNSPGSNSKALAALDSSHSNDVRHSSSSAKLRAKRSKPQKPNSPGRNSIALAAIESSHCNEVRHSSSSTKCLRAKQSKPKRQNKSGQRSLSRTSSSHYKLTKHGKKRVDSTCSDTSVTILPNIIHHPSTGSADNGVKRKGILLNRSELLSIDDIDQRKRSSYSRPRFDRHNKFK